MADDKLDNLNGDLTKLSSAWSGFMLNLEDGGGLMSSLARGSIQVLIKSISFLQEKTDLVSFFWGQFINDMKNVGEGFAIVGQKIYILAKEFQQFAVDTKLALKDVPFLGGLVDEKALLAQRKQLDGEIQYAKDKIWDLELIRLRRDKESQENYGKMLVRRLDIQKEVDTQLKGLANKFVEDTTKKDEEGLARLKANREKFFLKLKKLEEDITDKTEIEKIERKRLRHIAELDLLKLETTEKKRGSKKNK